MRDVIQLQFQFHKGAIRTFLRDSIPTFLDNFNSIKVRLERYKTYILENEI